MKQHQSMITFLCNIHSTPDNMETKTYIINMEVIFLETPYTYDNSVASMC